ncbi:MAG: hypothetical protein HY717_05535 [Planctomycetes bacterium]|nr:hypothetical protein [Planctomycetota bacterium]
MDISARAIKKFRRPLLWPLLWAMGGALFTASCRRGEAGAGDAAAVECIFGSQGKSPGRFMSPRSVAVKPGGGEVCVADRSGRIQRFLQQIAGEQQKNPGPASWQAANAWELPEHQIGQPTGIQYGLQGRLLVADTHYQRIRVYEPETGKLLASWGCKGTGGGQFTQVRDVAQASSGDIFASDYEGPADRIEKFDEAGRFLMAFGRRGTGPGEFNRPQGLAVAAWKGGEETLLVADSCNHRIQRFSLEGRFLQAWGSEGEGPGQFRYPYAVAVEPGPRRRLVVVEWQNNRLQCFDQEGIYLAAWGRPGRGPGELATPWDVALAPDGRAFVADFGNHRIQVVRLAEVWGGGAP